jgi:hypothetical protein
MAGREFREVHWKEKRSEEFPWLSFITKNNSCTHNAGIGRLVQIAVQQWFDGVPQQVHEGAVVVIRLRVSHNAVQGVLEHDGGSLLP